MPKGVYDRSTSRWQPPPRAEYPPDLVEKVRDLYAAGHTMAEVAALTGTTVKVLQRLMPRHGIARRGLGKRNQQGEKNATWRGDRATLDAMHLRVERVRGKPQRCALCDTADPSIRYEWANLSGHYNDIYDYARLCVPCHRRLDGRRRAATGRPTRPPGGAMRVA